MVDFKQLGFVKLDNECYKETNKRRQTTNYDVYAYLNKNGYKFICKGADEYSIQSFTLKLDDLFLYRVGDRLKEYNEELNRFMHNFERKFTVDFSWNYQCRNDYNKFISELDEYLDKLSSILTNLKINFYHFQDCYVVDTFTNFRIKDFVKGKKLLNKLPEECENYINVVELVKSK